MTPGERLVSMIVYCVVIYRILRRQRRGYLAGYLDAVNDIHREMSSVAKTVGGKGD